MSFRGDVRSMALDEVFGYLASNSLTGRLAVQSGDEVTAQLFFREGHLFFQDRARRGTYNLGKILRHTGVFSREGLRAYLGDLHKRESELAQQEGPGVAEARRLQFTEEVHDLFLWNEAQFEFFPGPWPASVLADFEAKRGYSAELTSLLMDVARREDERRRIRASLPTTRVVLETTEGSGDVVLVSLRNAKIEAPHNPFDGATSLETLLKDWGIPHHEALICVATLVERSLLAPLSRQVAESSVHEEVAGGRLNQASVFLGHYNEYRDPAQGRFDVELERHLVMSKSFNEGREVNLRIRLSGARTFSLLTSLISSGATFGLVLHGRGLEKQVCGLPGEAYVYDAPRREEPCPHLVDYLVEAGALKKKAAKAYRALEPSARPELKGVVAAGQLTGAKRARLVDVLAEVAFWRYADLEISNRAVRSSELTPEGESLEVSLDADAREELLKGFSRWAKTFGSLPSEACVYVQAGLSDPSDPAARFFQRFSLDRCVAELRREAQTTPLEFARFVARGVKRGYIRAPRVEELRKALKEARAAGREVTSRRLAQAGAAFGYAGFQAEFKKLGTAGVAAGEAGLEGDLDGVGLAAVLQSLRNNRRTGTLVVRSGRREERLCFQQGEAFFLEIDDSEGDAFVDFFLGEDGADSFGDLGGGAGGGRGLVAEDDLDRDELAELKKRFLDILLWDDSTFAFYQSSLPEEFFELGEGVTKIALRTQRFLLQAMQVMSAWEDASQVFESGAAELEFKDADAKHRAIRECGLPEMLTLIDGRLSFDDLVRASRVPRLEAGQLVAELVRLEVLSATVPPPEPVDLNDLPEPIPD